MESFQSKVNAVSCTLLQSGAIRKECLEHDYCEDENCLMCILRKICPYDTNYYDVDKMKDVLGCVLKDADKKLDENADVVNVFKAMSSPFQGFNQLIEEKVYCPSCKVVTELQPSVLRELQVCISDSDVQSAVDRYFNERSCYKCDACSTSTAHGKVVTVQPPDVLAVLLSTKLSTYAEQITQILPTLLLNSNENDKIGYSLVGANITVPGLTSSISFKSGKWVFNFLQKEVNVNVCSENTYVLLYDKIGTEHSGKLPTTLNLRALQQESMYPLLDETKTETENIATDKDHMNNNVEQLKKISHASTNFESEQYRKAQVIRKQLFEKDSFGKFSCPTCNRKFSMRHRFKTHLATHVQFKRKIGEQIKTITISKPKGFPCYFCSKSFTSGVARKKHVFQKHMKYEVPEFKRNSYGHFLCPLCPKSFKTNNLASNHFIQKFAVDPDELFYENGEYKCGYCNKKMPTIKHLKLHVGLKHKEYLSEECHNPIRLNKEIFLERLRVLQEQKVFTNEKVFCPFCKEFFKDIRSYKDHVKDSHTANIVPEEIKKIECNFCSKRFKNLNIHISRCHPLNRLQRKRYKKVNCPHCMKTFSSEFSFKQHLHPEAADCAMRKLECFICQKKFETPLALNVHNGHEHSWMKKLEDNVEAIVCEYCGTTLQNKKNFKQHLKLKHYEEALRFNGVVEVQFEKKEYGCTMCNKKFKFKKCLKNHVDKIHSVNTKVKQRNKLYICEYCNVKYTKRNSWRNHMKSNHLKNHVIKCDGFEDMRNLRKDLKVKHSLNNEIETDENGRLRPTLRQHVRHCHPDKNYFNPIESVKNNTKMETDVESNGTFVCKHCNAKFTKNYRWSQHLQCEHNEKRIIKCTRCAKCFENTRNLNIHFKREHSSNNDIQVYVNGRLECVLCRSTYKTRRSLKQHIRLNHPDSLCSNFISTEKSNEYTNETNSRLTGGKKEAHASINKEDKNIKTFVCQHCDAKFINRSILRIHRRMVHHEHRQVKCNDCGIAFENTRSLNIHISRKHSPYHKLQSNKNGRFECVFCNKNFAKRKSWSQHISRVHTNRKSPKHLPKNNTKEPQSSNIEEDKNR